MPNEHRTFFLLSNTRPAPAIASSALFYVQLNEFFLCLLFSSAVRDRPRTERWFWRGAHEDERNFLRAVLDTRERPLLQQVQEKALSQVLGVIQGGARGAEQTGRSGYRWSRHN